MAERNQRGGPLGQDLRSGCWEERFESRACDGPDLSGRAVEPGLLLGVGAYRKVGYEAEELHCVSPNRSRVHGGCRRVIRIRAGKEGCPCF